MGVGVKSTNACMDESDKAKDGTDLSPDGIVLLVGPFPPHLLLSVVVFLARKIDVSLCTFLS